MRVAPNGRQLMTTIAEYDAWEEDEEPTLLRMLSAEDLELDEPTLDDRTLLIEPARLVVPTSSHAREPLAWRLRWAGLAAFVASAALIAFVGGRADAQPAESGIRAVVTGTKIAPKHERRHNYKTQLAVAASPTVSTVKPTPPLPRVSPTGESIETSVSALPAAQPTTEDEPPPASADDISPLE